MDYIAPGIVVILLSAAIFVLRDVNKRMSFADFVKEMIYTLFLVRVFSSLWRRTTKRRAVLSNECLHFRRGLHKLQGERKFWRAAALIQSRCADSGHRTECFFCGQEMSCSLLWSSRWCSVSPNRKCKTASGVVSELMESVVPERADEVFSALRETEDADDIQEIFTPHPDLPYDRKGISGEPPGFGSSDLRDPHSHFYTRCRELIKDEYQGLPFAVKWEFAQSTVREQHLEAGHQEAMVP